MGRDRAVVVSVTSRRSSVGPRSTAGHNALKDECSVQNFYSTILSSFFIVITIRHIYVVFSYKASNDFKVILLCDNTDLLHRRSTFLSCSFPAPTTNF